MCDRVTAQTQQTADIGRRLEMHAHEMTSRMTFASAKKEALRWAHDKFTSRSPAMRQQ